MEPINKIILRDIKKPNENRKYYLTMEIKEDGHLYLSGYDYTPVAKDFTGDSEYEYDITIRSTEFPSIRSAFNIPAEENILDFLLSNYSGEKSFEFERLLNEKKIKSEFWSW